MDGSAATASQGPIQRRFDRAPDIASQPMARAASPVWTIIHGSNPANRADARYIARRLRRSPSTAHANAPSDMAIAKWFGTAR